MTITVLKNDKRLAEYHYKRTNSGKHHVKGVVAFYKALYAGTGAKITTIVRS